MAARNLGLIATIGLIASWPVHAQEPVGDIVDQVLNAKTLSSPDTPPPVAQQPPLSVSPTSLAPGPTSPMPATAASPAPLASPPDPTPPADIAAGEVVRLPAPLPAAVRWSGFYVGANLGGGEAHGGSSETCLNSTTGTTSGCDIIPSGALSPSGVLGGGQVGYLTSFDVGWSVPLMVGGEFDIGPSGISASQNINGPFSLVGLTQTCSPCAYTAKQSINWLSTLRARVGVPLGDNFLLYGTGGLAFGGVSVAQNLAFLGSTEGDFLNKTTTRIGPTIGAGLEFFVYGPWSAKLEGLYYNLGSMHTVAMAMNGAFVNFNNFKTFGFEGGIVRLGVNLKLGDFSY